MAVVGVDFGCLNAVLAQAERGGVKVLLNENSKRVNANMVSIQGKQRFLGEAASSIARSNYKNTVSCIKRFVGRKFNDPGLAEEMARSPGLTYVEMDDGYVGVEVDYDGSRQKLSMPHFAGMMLHKLSLICAAQESNKGVSIAEAVMSVPAWFTVAQRFALLDAFDVAGLKCLRLMHDTTATALEYGIWRSVQKMFDDSKGSRVLFVDLGYSSYQVSVVEYVQGKLCVKATTFDKNLGGRDFDTAIAEYVAAEFEKKYPGENPLSSPKPKMKLLDACEKAKKTLSPHGVGEANMYIECLMNDRDFTLKLTLEKFEELVAPLLDRLVPPLEAALAESGTASPKELHSVEIVGGGSRVASVKRKLATTLELDTSLANYGLKTTMNADEAVAKGCAMQAAMLSPRFKVKEYTVVEAAPYAVRLAWDNNKDSRMSSEKVVDDDETPADAIEADETSECVLFARNSETPKERRVTFSKFSDFVLSASYAEGPNAPISEFKVTGVPAAPSDAPAGFNQKVRVFIEQTINGTLKVKNAELVQQHLVVEDAREEGGGEKMDDGEGAEGGGPEAAPPPAAEGGDLPKKKRKQTKTPLSFEENFPKMDKKAIDAAIELEAQMANADRVIQETNDMRNNLEAYVYKMRDDIIDPLRPYIDDGEKTKFETMLNDAESWLYDGDGYDASKSAYYNRLEALKKIGEPVVARQREDAERPVAVSALQRKLEDLKTWANSNDGAYEHVTDEEKSTVRSEANKASDWLLDLLDQQSGRPLTVDPVIKVDDIRKKIDQVQAVAKPIMNKPKPKPAPPAPESKDAKDVDMPDATPAAPDADPATSSSPEQKDVDMPDAFDQAAAGGAEGKQDAE